MSEVNGTPGMGWLPDYTDFRNRTIDHEEVTAATLSSRQDTICSSLINR